MIASYSLVVLVNIATVLFSALFESSALRSSTRDFVIHLFSFLNSLFFLGYHHLRKSNVKVLHFQATAEAHGSPDSDLL